MNKLTLILVRHGRTDHNVGLRMTGWGDPGLDEVGLVQAEATALTLSENYRIEAIYTSPLQRAVQTGDALVKLTGLKPLQHDDLKEFFFGEVEGLTIPEARQQFPDHFATGLNFDAPEFSWPGGETRLVFHTRVDRAIWNIISVEAGLHQTVAIFSHGAALAGFLSELQTGQPYQWRRFLLENAEYYCVEVHFSELPITRANCTLKVIHTGILVPLPPDR